MAIGVGELLKASSDSGDGARVCIGGLSTGFSSLNSTDNIIDLPSVGVFGQKGEVIVTL